MNLTSANIEIKDAMELYTPKKLLVIYEKEGYNSDFYVEESMLVNGMPLGFHPIDMADAKLLIGSIAATENGMVKSEKLLPRNVLLFSALLSQFQLIWYQPSSIKQMKFQVGTGFPEMRVKVPALLYVATRNSLSVFALKGRTVPTEKTELYIAPFFNTFGDGKVCMGSATVKIASITSIIEIIASYERAFWYSEFTRSGNTSSLAIWKRLSKNKLKLKTFPLKELKKHPIYPTLKDLVDGKQRKTKNTLYR